MTDKLPFIISFDEGADGGPEHFVEFLYEYGVTLKKDGKVIYEGVITSKPDGEGNFFMKPFEEIKQFNLYTDFDEIVYL
jgi:hypothetical protein